MPSDLLKSLSIAASGMKAQSDRLRIVSENIANSETTGQSPTDQPYRRKTLYFKDVLDREIDAHTVKVDRYDYDKSQFEKRYEPGHPAADEAGYVLYPNVNPMSEMMDMREARMGYEANMNVIEASKSMLQQTIGMLRN
jgi:flagellar basal-body rod protein FlgC